MKKYAYGGYSEKYDMSGVITMGIRYFGSYAEGVSYAILIMNVSVYLLDKVGTPRRFGYVKPKKEAESK